MLLTGLLLVLLASYALLRVVLATVHALDLDPWATLVYLGLAEHEEKPRALPRAHPDAPARRPRQRARALRTAPR